MLCTHMMNCKMFHVVYNSMPGERERCARHILFQSWALEQCYAIGSPCATMSKKALPGFEQGLLESESNVITNYTIRPHAVKIRAVSITIS